MSESKLVKCLKFDNREPTAALNKAYQILSGHNLSTEWISEEDVMAIVGREANAIFVVDPFEGAAFQKLKDTSNRVYGPQCMLSCLESSKPIPKAVEPIYNVAMRGLSISCTSLSRPVREDIHSKVVLMGGEVSKDFTEHVTHLVADEVGSKKYIVAANLNKPVMLPAWVYEVWASSQHNHIHATDEEFCHHRCPIFKGFVTTVSGFDSVDRKELQKAVEENGGRYSGEMRVDECTHLIINEPKGQKYEFAKKWKIHIVTSAWVFQSIKKGYCLDESLYQTANKSSPVGQLTSTPTKPKNHGRISIMSDVSAITNISTASHINETYMSGVSLANQTRQISDDLDALDALDISQVKGDLFLDGCKIFLSWFEKSKLEKLRKIINIGGGTRYNEISGSVSHVVMGEMTEEHVRLLQQTEHRPHVVTVAWLIKCFELGRFVPEDEFRIPLQTNAMSPVLKTRKSASLSSPTKGNESVINRSHLSKADMMTQQIQEQDLMSQYLPQPNQGESVSDSALMQVAALNPADEECMSQEDTLDPGDTTLTGAGIFSQKSFVICDFEPEHEEHLNRMIKENGGMVHSAQARIVPNYAVVPIFGTQVTISVEEVVTNAWLQMCLEYEKLLPVTSNELFTPMSVAMDTQPLTSCVLSISGYQGCERDCLMHVAEFLGAKCQEYFVKKASGQLLASTHLLVNSPEGSKYNAALKWKLPTVTSKWLFACLKTGKKVSEENYLIRKQIEEACNKENKVAAPLPAQVLDQTEKDSPKPVNARLNSLRGEERKTNTPGQRSKQTRSLSEDSPVTRGGPGIDTPGKFLKPGKHYQPVFDIEDAYATLNTPTSGHLSAQNKRRRSSYSFDEVFGKHMEQALKNSTFPEARAAIAAADDDDDEVVLKQPAGPLKGVIIAVSKKLSAQQSEYNNMAAMLGADYRWTYDNSCTHFIFKGKTNDTTKEFRVAKDQGKYIVSPYWLIMCNEKKTRVDESLYPHNCNPNLQLSVIANKSRTPHRTPKRKTRAATKSLEDQNEKAYKIENTPAVKIPNEEAEQRTQGTTEQLTTDPAPEQQAVSGSLELREELSKQLENIMAVTMPEKHVRRKSRKSTHSADSSVDTSTGFNRSRPSSRLNKNDPPEVVSDASQSVQVTWDDVEGRLEHERLADELKRVYNPTQSCDDRSPPFCENANQFPTVKSFPESKDETSDSPKAKPTDFTSVPLQPPIAFPTPKTVSSVEAVTELKEYRPTSDSRQVPVFQLSGLTQEERDEYGALVEQLGGKISESQSFDPACTHLVVGTPTRNEKFLAAVATGKWVLHKSYFQACEQESHFVQEEDHEWGSEATLTVTSALPEQLQKLAAAAHRWRLYIHQLREENPDLAGAFEGWRIILITDSARLSRFQRLLESGGAVVLPHSTKQLSEVTHAFLDVSKMKEEIKISHLIEAGIKCLKPEYIAAFLMEVPSPNMDSYLISELRHKKLRSVAQEDNSSPSRKRKTPSTSSNSSSKRSRH